MAQAMNVETARDEQYENAEGLERNWAVEAMSFAELHWLLLVAGGKPSEMKITKADNEVYAAFRAAFPDMNIENIDEDEMKSEKGKAKWRAFLEGVLKPLLTDDYNFGTLLRTNTKGEYSPDNTLLALRGQFYTIEIARNREGLNDSLK